MTQRGIEFRVLVLGQDEQDLVQLAVGEVVARVRNEEQLGVEGKGGCLSRLLDLGGNLRPLENVRVRESASSMMPSAGQWTVKSGDGGGV